MLHAAPTLPKLSLSTADMHRVNVAASHIPSSGRLGRWSTRSSSGSLISGWCGSTLSFLFTGSTLSLSIGNLTERMDNDNGGTPMCAIIHGQTQEAALRDTESWRTADPEPGSEVIVFDGRAQHERTFVQLTLIDWASKFELEALIVDHGGKIEPTPANISDIPRILVIGDSISCGFAAPTEQGGEPIPFGVLDAFPFVANRLLLEYDDPVKLNMEFIGYPGINLVSPTEEERGKGRPNGMIDMFFWTSSWDKSPSDLMINTYPTILLIELGTNDQAFEISAERFKDALSAFILNLVEYFSGSVRKVWIIPPFPDADTANRELSLSMASLTSSFNGEERFNGIQISICDLVEALTTKDTVDGVHPSLEVHKKIGWKLAEFIKENV